MDGGRIAVISQREARQSLKIIEQQQVRTVLLPYTSIKPYLSANGNQVALIAASPVQTPSVVVVDVDSGDTQTIAATQPLADPQLLSQPTSFGFTARDGAEVQGLYYPPGVAFLMPGRHWLSRRIPGPPPASRCGWTGTPNTSPAMVSP